MEFPLRFVALHKFKCLETVAISKMFPTWLAIYNPDFPPKKILKESGFNTNPGCDEFQLSGEQKAI